jgi:inosose dehydratase
MKPLRVGNAPCSWGTLEFEGMKSKPIGYAQMLDELRETGYEGSELGDWGFMPTDPARLEQEFRRRDLALLGAFVPVRLKDPFQHEPGEDRALRVAELLAATHQRLGSDTAPFLVLADENGTEPERTWHAGRITAGMGLKDSEWDAFAAGAQRIAAAVRKATGLRTVFHHHCAGYIETPDEIEILLSRTDPDLVGLVFDTGHLAFGSGISDGAAVLQALDRFADRIWYVHLKDCHPEIADRARREGWDYFASVRNGVFCELGKGCVDFRAVLDWLRRREYQGWLLVEQDVLPGLGSPKESARRNREHLRSLGV